MSSEYRTDKLMQHLGVSALFLGVIYIIVVFLVWRGVKRVFNETPHWNALKIFCVALLIVPIFRACSFIVHFLLYEGSILPEGTPAYVKDFLVNTLYIIPTFIFIFTYMVLICIWIEITMFSRDQYIIQHDKYRKIWRWVYGTVITFIFLGLSFVFTWSLVTEKYEFLSALYTSLWIMTFFVPLTAFVIWIFLVVRFAGFPYLNRVWKQQTQRMFHVILVWTVGQLISGAMTTVWTADKGDWLSKNDYLWFSLSVALTLIFAEILPLIYTSDWRRMGFLLMAFVNWRDLWLRNESTALIYDPRLIDDPLHPKAQRTDNELQSSISINSTNKTPLLSPAGDLLLRNAPLFSTSSISRRRIIPHDKKISFSKLIIDRNLIISKHPLYEDTTAYYSIHHVRYPLNNDEKNNNNNNNNNNNDSENNNSFCLKIFQINTIETSMIESIIDNLCKFKKLKNDNLGIIYDINLNIENNNSKKQIEILSEWCPGGSLFDIIDMSPKDTPFAMHVVKRMILQIASFMDWLHRECKIPHGHLKSRNILFDKEMNVKISDIGLISLKKTMTVLLPNANFDGYWMDKEYFEGKAISFESDVWAFGFILYELQTKKQPFDGIDTIDQIKKCILNTNIPEIPDHCPLFMKNLIVSCWDENRTKRPSFQNIIKIIQTKMP